MVIKERWLTTRTGICFNIVPKRHNNKITVYFEKTDYSYMVLNSGYFFTTNNRFFDISSVLAKGFYNYQFNKNDLIEHDNGDMEITGNKRNWEEILKK